MKALLALGFLGLAAADTVKTVRNPTRRGTLHAGTPGAVKISLNFTNRWIKGGGGYFINLDIGTPTQRIEVLLDTGSSDLWVPSAAASQCLSSQCAGGSFNSSNSETFRPTNDPFRIAYGDKSQVNGNYALDNIVSGQARLRHFKFAVSDDFTTFDEKNKISYGILGIGTRETEAEAYSGRSVPTFNDAMVSAGYVGSNSYSLFLDDKDSPSGSILFGGVDTAKFTGPLITTQAEKDKEAGRQRGQYLHQKVNLINMTSNSNGTSRQYIPRALNVWAALDSGASGIHLPVVWYETLVRDMPILWNTTTWMRTQMKTGPLVYCEDVGINTT